MRAVQTEDAVLEGRELLAGLRHPRRVEVHRKDLFPRAGLRQDLPTDRPRSSDPPAELRRGSRPFRTRGRTPGSPRPAPAPGASSGTAAGPASPPGRPASRHRRRRDRGRVRGSGGRSRSRDRAWCAAAAPSPARRPRSSGRPPPDRSRSGGSCGRRRPGLRRGRGRARCCRAARHPWRSRRRRRPAPGRSPRAATPPRRARPRPSPRGSARGGVPPRARSPRGRTRRSSTAPAGRRGPPRPVPVPERPPCADGIRPIRPRSRRLGATKRAQYHRPGIRLVGTAYDRHTKALPGCLTAA